MQRLARNFNQSLSGELWRRESNGLRNNAERIRWRNTNAMPVVVIRVPFRAFATGVTPFPLLRDSYRVI